MSNSDPVDSFLFALGQKESSGKYEALGPVIKIGAYKGDRAYGKYQVMGKNVSEWTKQYLGKAMTPQEFLSNTQAQDQLMKVRANELFNKYGNWEDVASVHFSGRPLSQAKGAKDQLGTSVKQYVKDVASLGLGGGFKKLALDTGNVASAMLPGLRIAAGKLTGEDTTGFKSLLAENKTKFKNTLTTPTTYRDESGNIKVNPVALEGKLNFVMGFLGDADLTNVIKNLAKETSPSLIKGILKNKPFRLADEVIEQIAPDIAKATEPEEVNQIINKANNQSNSVRKSELSEAQVGQTKPKPSTQTLVSNSPIGQALEPYLKNVSYEDDISKTLAKSNVVQPTNYKVNIDHFDIKKDARAIISKEVNDLKPYFESKIGGKLSNKEVRKVAEQSSEYLSREVGVEQTKRWEAGMDNLRAKIAKAAKEERVDKEFIENLKVLKTQSTDIARKLQSFSMDVEARTPQQQLIAAILDVSDNADDILKAAQGVDFNDFQQASEFYRKFVKPKAGEWVDLLRYNSMLSSPLTHIVNTASNLVNSLVVAPIEKAVAGGVDFIGSTVTGKERTQFSGEGAAFLGSYFKNIGEASRRFMDVMAGKRSMTNLDARNIPLATKGIKGAAVSTLSFPLRLLDASDQFFTELTESAERAALSFREGKGVKVPNLEAQAGENAAYRLYRQDLFSKDQGVVLDAVDRFTSSVMSLRNSDNPIVATIAKFTAPFIKTPMNIFKQGIEYSPMGVATLAGASNKTTQLAKTAIGSAVFTGASLLLASDRITWSEPSDERTKNLWRQAGKQPYSVKIGDKWFSYQKLPPPLAFPIAMVAAIDDAQKSKKIDDSTTDLVLSAVAKGGEFLADQSYAKSFGDLLNAFQGGESKWANLLANYPQQLIPFRALTGWLARLSDDVQRKPDADASFVDKQVQLLMMNYPGLSQKVPARENNVGEPIPNNNRWWNALSPVRMQQEAGEFKSFLDNYEKYAALTRQENQKIAQLKERAESLYAEYKSLSPEEANNRALELKETEPRVYSRLKDIVEENKYNYTQEEKYIKSLGVENGLRAKYIWDGLQSMETPDEKNVYLKNLKDKKVVTEEVFKQLRKMKTQ